MGTRRLPLKLLLAADAVLVGCGRPEEQSVFLPTPEPIDVSFDPKAITRIPAHLVKYTAYHVHFLHSDPETLQPVRFRLVLVPKTVPPDELYHNFLIGLRSQAWENCGAQGSLPIESALPAGARLPVELPKDDELWTFAYLRDVCELRDCEWSVLAFSDPYLSKYALDPEHVPKKVLWALSRAAGPVVGIGVGELSAGAFDQENYWVPFFHSPDLAFPPLRPRDLPQIVH